MKTSHRMHSVTLPKRLSALEAVVEERLEEEIWNLLALLEQHLSHKEFLKVARIAAWGPSKAGVEGEG